MYNNVVFKLVPGAIAQPNDLEKRITEVFEFFDHEGDKKIDVREVGTIIRALGAVPTEAEIQEIITNVEDPAEPGRVPIYKFLPYVSGILSEYKLQPASAEELLKAFQTLDKEKKGYLTTEFVTQLMMEEGEPFTQEEMDEMLSIVVDPESNKINYEYYINQILVNVQPNIYSLIPSPEDKSEPSKM